MDWVRNWMRFSSSMRYLQDSDKISHEVSLELAEGEYEKYQVKQDGRYALISTAR